MIFFFSLFLYDSQSEIIHFDECNSTLEIIKDENPINLMRWKYDDRVKQWKQYSLVENIMNIFNTCGF